MDQLWAPWRLAYVTVEGPKTDQECFLCTGLAATDDRKNLIAWRTRHSVVMLNKYPYNNGHLLIAPQAHKASLQELTFEEILDTQVTLRRMVGLFDDMLRPDGYNIGVNLGRAAGAGLPTHLHWHLVPRWHGDTNFMPILGGTKVIVQALDSLYELLTAKIHERFDDR